MIGLARSGSVWPSKYFSAPQAEPRTFASQFPKGVIRPSHMLSSQNAVAPYPVLGAQPPLSWVAHHADGIKKGSARADLSFFVTQEGFIKVTGRGDA